MKQTKRDGMIGCLCRGGIRRIAALAALISIALAAGVLARGTDAAQANWPYGANVDETMFAPGGSGLTIYASPTGKGSSAGTAADPCDLATAMKRADEAMRSMETAYVQGNAPIAFPVWLRLVRNGNAFAVSMASDSSGNPGTWTQIGEPRDVRMGSTAWVGVMVNSADRWPPEKTAAAATLDHVRLNGKPVPDGAWSMRRIGTAEGRNEVTIEGDTIRVLGNGPEARWMGKANFADAGMASLLRASGDFDLVARLTRLDFPDKRDNANVMLVAREADDHRIVMAQGPFANSERTLADRSTAARMAQIQVTAHRDSGAATYDAYAAWRADLPKPGRDVRVVLLPGIYRPTSGQALPVRDLVARNKTFVIEGQRQGEHSGGVVISGSAVEGWQGSTWKRGADGSYSHPWTQTWGGDKLEDRREMLYLTPQGKERIRLRQVMAADFKAEPGTFAVNEAEKTIRMALPSGLAPAAFAGQTLVEVPLLTDYRFLHCGIDNSSQWLGNNFVLRNIVFEHFAGDAAVQFQWWPEPNYPSQNILLEDVTFRENARMGFSLNHIRDFTFRRVRSVDNGQGNWLIAAEGQVIDCEFSRNGWRKECEVIWNALRNTRFSGCQFNDNRGIPVRNDHVAENVVFDGCTFARNHGAVAIFETAMGPITFRNSSFLANDPGSKPDQDGILQLAGVSNVTFDGCTFTDNKRACIVSYPRERSHVANKPGDDELCNNLDIGRWDTGNTPEERAIPRSKKGINGNRDMTVHDCTFTASGPEDRFLVQTYWQRPDGYRRLISQDWRAWNNRYFNPSCPKAFEVGTNTQWGVHVYGTLEQWRQVSQQENFEAGSVWGEKPGPTYTPTAPPIANSGTKSTPRVGGSTLTYNVQDLPFTASQPVLLLTDAQASGGKFHKLAAVQVGDHGDWVEYTLNVPADGDYYVNVRYQQHNRPFDYRGYAQLKIDGKLAGPYWDQDGLTTQFMTISLGQVHLSAGEHAFRFESVWRNGYNSGDYPITIDRIELAKEQPMLPAVAAQGTRPGLQYEVYEGEWKRLPDFARLQPIASGVLDSPDTKRATGEEQCAIRFSGFLQVPVDGIYRIDTVANDGANLYVHDQLVVDNDGVHDGEKNEPWRKSGYVALKAGKHPVRIDYFNGPGGTGMALELWYSGPGVQLQRIPVSAWSYAPSGKPAIPASLLPRISADDSGLPRGWRTEDWNRDKLKVQDEVVAEHHAAGLPPGKLTYMHIVPAGMGNMFVSRDVPVQPEWKELRLSAWVRLKGLKHGDPGWKTARVALEPKEGEQVVAGIDADTDWRPITLTLPIRPGMSSVKVNVGFLYSMGELDFANPKLVGVTQEMLDVEAGRASSR